MDPALRVAERRLYRVTAAGAQQVESTPIQAYLFDRPWWRLSAADYDGDGLVELVEVQGNSGAESCGYNRVRVLTWQGEALVPYAPAQDFQALGVSDANGDGRPDLLLANPFSAHDEGLCGDPHYAFFLPAFSLDDGSFSTTGSAAETYVHEQCPYVPSFQGLTYLGDTALAAVTCGRYWGLAPEAIIAELVRIDAAADMSHYSLEGLQTAAQLSPLFQLSEQ
jgi:hypothetical protein